STGDGAARTASGTHSPAAPAGPGRAYAVWLVRQHRKGPAVSEPDDSLRVSDAERDAVLHTLGDHAAVGRLTLDELEAPPGPRPARKAPREAAPPTRRPAARPGAASPRAPAPSRREPVRWVVAIL